MRLAPNQMSVCVFQEVIGNSVKQAVCFPLYTISERYSLFLILSVIYQTDTEPKHLIVNLLLDFVVRK